MRTGNASIRGRRISTSAERIASSAKNTNKSKETTKQDLAQTAFIEEEKKVKPKTKRNPKYAHLNNFADMPKDELRKAQSRGGKKSAETRKRRKDMRECAKVLMDMPALDDKEAIKLLNAGLEKDDITMRMMVVTSLVKSALNGSVVAFQELKDLTGEGNSIGVDGDSSLTINIVRANNANREE